ncbi:MAG: hypothetical protein ACRD0D_03400, partial [Acidimicrobiales bacterium]
LGTTVTSVNLRTGGLALTPATCTSPCTRGEAVSGSPLTGTIRYQAGGNEFLVHIDLGRLVSRATYTPAPTP